MPNEPIDGIALSRTPHRCKVIPYSAGAARAQLDRCDEIGLLVYEESYAAWAIADCPEMGERFDRSVGELIRHGRRGASVDAAQQQPYGLTPCRGQGCQLREIGASPM